MSQIKPKKVLFINSKGGVGKSTLVDELCFECDIRGIPYSMHNLDPQGTLLHEPVNNPDAVLDFIDTPGHIQDKALTYMQAADCIIIPTGMTQNCISSLEYMLKVSTSVKKTPVLLVYNFWDGGIACEHFQDYCDKITELPAYKDRVQTVHISRSVNFANARELGIGVAQYRKHCKSSEEIDDFFCHVMDACNMYEWFDNFRNNRQMVEVTIKEI